MMWTALCFTMSLVKFLISQELNNDFNFSEKELSKVPRIVYVQKNIQSTRYKARKLQKEAFYHEINRTNSN